jgi:hypothetical protein
MVDKKWPEIKFDIAIPTPKGMLFAMYIHQDTEIAGATADAGLIILIQQAHDHLAHTGEELTQKMAKELGWKLMCGSLKPCNACADSKAKQKNVPQASKHQVAKVNEAQR